jgi:hypothetical protein
MVRKSINKSITNKLTDKPQMINERFFYRTFLSINVDILKV